MTRRPDPESSPGGDSVAILTSPENSSKVEELLSTLSSQQLSYTISTRSYISGEQLVSLVIEHWQDLDVLSMLIGAIALRGIRVDIEIRGITIKIKTPSGAHDAVKELKRLLQKESEDDDD